MTQHTLETETGFAAKDSRGNVNSCSDFGLRACAGRETESAKGKKIECARTRRRECSGRSFFSLSRPRGRFNFFLSGFLAHLAKRSNEKGAIYKST